MKVQILNSGTIGVSVSGPDTFGRWYTGIPNSREAIERHVVAAATEYIVDAHSIELGHLAIDHGSGPSGEMLQYHQRPGPVTWDTETGLILVTAFFELVNVSGEMRSGKAELKCR